MSFDFRPAVREGSHLILGLAAPSGGGKTWSAQAVATGLAGGKRFAVIDTEARRACHYADVFSFDHGDLTAPFSPARYAEAIKAADDAGYPVIVVDSFSHEHAGEGGLLDMQAAEFTRLGMRDNVKMLSWVGPKSEHKKLMSLLLQVRAHLILCLRAEQKVDIVQEGGKTIVRPKTTLSGFSEWIPIAEKTLSFELTASALLLPDAPGIPRWIKLPEALRRLVPPGPLTEQTGERFAEWAAGGAGGAPTGSTPKVVNAAPAPAGSSAMLQPTGTEGTPSDPPLSRPGAVAPPMADSLRDRIKRLLANRKPSEEEFSRYCARAGVLPDRWERADVATLQDLFNQLNTPRAT